MTRAQSGAAEAAATEDFEEPAGLRRLRRLVTALIVVLILGVLTVVAVIVIRLGALEIAPQGPGLAPFAAERLVLPADHEVLALGRAGQEVLVLLQGPGGAETLHRYHAADGALLSVTEVIRASTAN